MYSSIVRRVSYRPIERSIIQQTSGLFCSVFQIGSIIGDRFSFNMVGLQPSGHYSDGSMVSLQMLFYKIA